MATPPYWQFISFYATSDILSKSSESKHSCGFEGVLAYRPTFSGTNKQSKKTEVFLRKKQAQRKGKEKETKKATYI